MSLERNEAIALLRDMLRIRRLEERAAQLYGQMKIRGFLHLGIGQEAAAVGVIRGLDSEDAVVSTYREHGHALIRGVGADRILAEMFGKLSGCSRGRGGSMHLFCAGTRMFGGSAIVGGGIPLAVGLALADKMQGRPHLTASIFGEGAMAEGVFHESINLAALWKLPVLFLCENNLYAMGTAIERSQAQTDPMVKARANTVPAASVDGMDVEAVLEATRRAAAQVRSGAGPFFLELKTYRFRAHSMFDPELYRSKAEVQEWKKRDPIPLYAQRLEAAGMLAPEELRRLEEEAAEEIEKAVAFAEAAPWERVEELERFVVAEKAP